MSSAQFASCLGIYNKAAKSSPKSSLIRTQLFHSEGVLYTSVFESFLKWKGEGNGLLVEGVLLLSVRRWTTSTLGSGEQILHPREDQPFHPSTDRPTPKASSSTLVRFNHSPLSLYPLLTTLSNRIPLRCFRDVQNPPVLFPHNCPKEERRYQSRPPSKQINQPLQNVTPHKPP